MRSLVLLLLVGIFPVKSYCQQTSFPEGYYVIVGAFAIKENAEKFNRSLNRKNMQSTYGYLASRRLYYVYTQTNPKPAPCFQAARELRKKPQFSDAWVRYINEKENADNLVEEEHQEVETRQEMTASIAPAAVTPSAETQTEETEGEETQAEETPEVQPNEEIVQYDPVTLGNTEVFLSLYNARTDRVIEGNVLVIDSERGREIKKVEGNAYLALPDPKSKSGALSLICDVFGYRKVQKDLNFNTPLADSSVVEHIGTTLMVNFELVRYQKGDIRTLYNIYFYNDAAVMMPESKFEVNALLDMMKENSNYRIKLHGHTNGSYHGKIIRRGASGDFFSVAKDAKTTIGSAKELSESRAEVIRDYLIANGIDASRVEIKAWGGKRPLYDKNSANAKKNIRVEVEMLSD